MLILLMIFQKGLYIINVCAAADVFIKRLYPINVGADDVLEKELMMLMVMMTICFKNCNNNLKDDDDDDDGTVFENMLNDMSVKFVFIPMKIMKFAEI